MSPDQRPEDPEHGLDVDAAFAAIIEHYGERPVLEDEQPPADPEPEPEPGVGAYAPYALADPAARHPDPPRPAWEDEGHFVPPAPPPAPPMDPRRRVAWTGLFGAPAILLVLLVLSVTAPGWLVVGLAFTFIGSFVYLVATMGRGRDATGPGDDGAVV